MKCSFDSLLQELMQNEKFQNSMIQQLAEYGDRLIQEIQAVPEGGIHEESLIMDGIWPETVGIEGKSHLYTHLTESLSDSIIRIDRGGTIRGANHASEILFGFSREQLVGKSFLDLVHREDRDKLFELWSASFRNHSQAFQIKLCQHDNSYTTVSIKAIPLIKGTSFQGSLLAINDQVKSADQDSTDSSDLTCLSDTEPTSNSINLDLTTEKIRKILHEIKEIFYIASAEGKITYINPEVKNVLGYAPEEFTAMKIEAKFANAKDRSHFLNLLELHGWVKDFHYCFLHKNGTTCHLSETASVILDNKDQVTGYYGIIRDRTAEHQIEKALKDSEENYRFLVEQLPHALILLNQKGRILHANQKGTRFLHAERLQSIRGRSIFEICLPENSKLVRDAVGTVSLGDSITNNWLWVDSEKDQHWWQMYFSPVYIGSEVDKIIWICVNIDREKRLEDHARLSQKMETVATLVGGLAHDFNNQLGVILGNASIVKDRLSPDSEYYEELDAIESTALKARIMMNQLLTFTTKRLYQQENISINELISNMAEFIQRTFPKNINVSTKLEANPDTIIGDPDNIFQALLNICVNSRDAMPEGGNIIIASQNVMHDTVVNGQTPDHFIQITVSDSGEGMDEDTSRRMCEPFFTTRRDMGCTGLGMSTTYSVVQQHGGFLEVDSKKGSGTKVELFLPQADGENVEEVSMMPSTTKFEISHDRETILIVDDEPQVRAMIFRIFEREGFKVLMAENGIKALETLDQHADDIHLIILDMTMPQMGGKETIGQIRKQYTDIPVLLSSGYTLNQEIQELIKQPHTYFIHKPYRRATILETVQQIFAKSLRFSDQ